MSSQIIPTREASWPRPTARQDWLSISMPRKGLSAFLFLFGAPGDIPPCIRHRPLVPVDSVVRTSRWARMQLGGEARDRDIWHEPALVSRTCGPVKLLGLLKFGGTPRYNDARRCHYLVGTVRARRPQ